MSRFAGIVVLTSAVFLAVFCAGHSQEPARNSPFHALPAVAGTAKETEDTETKKENGKNGEEKKEEEREEPEEEEPEEEEYEEPSDLGIWNFWDGWCDRWEPRSRWGRAPRFHFFTTRQTILDREFRMNYVYASNTPEGNEHELEFELEFPFNRRFMLDVEPIYSWLDRPNGVPNGHGPRFDVISYFQLVDTYHSALNFQFGVLSPAGTVGIEIVEQETTIIRDSLTGFSAAFAGFEDLTWWGPSFYRTGFYYHANYLTFVGPGQEEEPRNFLDFGLSMSKTYTEPNAFLGDLSLFLEAFAATELDGNNPGHTDVTMTPGIRFNFGTEQRPWWLMFGVSLPVSGPEPFDGTFRIALIRWFE